MFLFRHTSISEGHNEKFPLVFVVGSHFHSQEIKETHPSSNESRKTNEFEVNDPLIRCYYKIEHVNSSTKESEK